MAFYVQEHNAQLPHSAFRGQTPDEMYFGTGDKIPAELEAARQRARQARAEANLIHLLQDMIESGVSMSHVDTPGGYIEVDTQEDFEYARQHWQSRHLGK